MLWLCRVLLGVWCGVVQVRWRWEGARGPPPYELPRGLHRTGHASPSSRYAGRVGPVSAAVAVLFSSSAPLKPLPLGVCARGCVCRSRYAVCLDTFRFSYSTNGVMDS